MNKEILNTLYSVFILASIFLIGVYCSYENPNKLDVFLSLITIITVFLVMVKLLKRL